MLGTPRRGDDPQPHWSDRWLPKLMQAIGELRTSRYSDLWEPQTFTLPTGRSKHIAHRNPQRARLLLWTDGGNTSPVWIGPAPFNGTDAPAANDGYVPLAPGSTLLELRTTGDVFAWSSSNGNVCLIQEYAQ